MTMFHSLALLMLLLLAVSVASCSSAIQDTSGAKFALAQLESKLISDLDKVEFDNILVKNREQLTNDYQPSSCQLVQIVHLLHHSGCQPKAIASFACSGSCPSYVRAATSKFWQHERSCSCCQQTGSQEAIFTLDCPSLDPPYRKVKTFAPVGCLCRSCTDLGREDLRPQELVEALANELANGGGEMRRT